MIPSDIMNRRCRHLLTVPGPQEIDGDRPISVSFSVPSRMATICAS
ncbi:hypothetical protein RSPO_m00057 (plasmid) [Ralstonia solanacearum Po82]|uniref:Uncharacterized protein n=1 Tax=Ralstonia solanacearum (strain Po82) TaxID=1031711 RepID=F6G821_RALS8|nr:hypothetical protein RSPO_m00057 [Ralstonia solanacearum Po82]